MLNNRRRTPEVRQGWARIRANVSVWFMMNPLTTIVLPSFVLIGLLFIGTSQLVSRSWPGACYEVHFETQEQTGRQRPVCLKHIPFADGSSTTRSS